MMPDFCIQEDGCLLCFAEEWYDITDGFLAHTLEQSPNVCEAVRPDLLIVTQVRRTGGPISNSAN